jgi:hypothetical protein
MKPPWAYARGILHFFSAIRRSTLLRSAPWSRFSLGGSRLDRGAYSTGRAELRRVPLAHSSVDLRPWSSAKADKTVKEILIISTRYTQDDKLS